MATAANPTVLLCDNTPAAPVNGKNVVWQKTGTNPVKISGAIVGDGNPSHFLRGDGLYASPGGGGGGVPSGSNVVQAAQRLSTDSAYSGDSVVKQLKAGNMWNLASTWRFSLSVNGTASYVVNAVVYRTLVDDTTITDVTAVTFAGLSTGSVTTGEVFSDTISVVLDADHDAYIVIYFQSGTGTLNIGAGLLANDQKTGFVSGDKTGLTAGGTIPTGLSNEETVYRVLSV